MAPINTTYTLTSVPDKGRASYIVAVAWPEGDVVYHHAQSKPQARSIARLAMTEPKAVAASIYRQLEVYRPLVLAMVIAGAALMAACSPLAPSKQVEPTRPKVPFDCVFVILANGTEIKCPPQ